MTSGTDSYVTVSGAAAQYKIDSYIFGDEYRQVVVLGGTDASGDIANVNPSGALEVSAIGGTITANLGATDNAVIDSILTKNTEIDAVLDTIKVDTEAIETATEAIQVDAAAIEVLLTGIDADTNAIKVDAAANEVLLTGIDGVLDNILIKNTEIDAVLDTIKVDTEAIETAVEGSLAVNGNLGVSGNLTLSSVYIDEDANADNPQTNLSIITAPGAGKRLRFHGYALTTAGTGTSSFGRFIFANGNIAGSEATGAINILCGGMIMTNVGHTMCDSLVHGIPLSENTALTLTVTEASTNVFIFGVVYCSTETV